MSEAMSAIIGLMIGAHFAALGIIIMELKDINKKLTSHD